MDIKVKEGVSANVLEVKVGTTGKMGGDYSHGGETYFSLKDLSCTNMEINPLDNNYYGKVDGFELTLRGDCELLTFIEALEFAVEELKKAYNS